MTQNDTPGKRFSPTPAPDDRPAGQTRPCPDRPKPTEMNGPRPASSSWGLHVSGPYDRSGFHLCAGFRMPPRRFVIALVVGWLAALAWLGWDRWGVRLVA